MSCRSNKKNHVEDMSQPMKTDNASGGTKNWPRVFTAEHVMLRRLTLDVEIGSQEVHVG